jgi:hypothetical protein
VNFAWVKKDKEMSVYIYIQVRHLRAKKLIKNVSILASFYVWTKSLVCIKMQ